MIFLICVWYCLVYLLHPAASKPRVTYMSNMYDIYTQMPLIPKRRVSWFEYNMKSAQKRPINAARLV